MPTLIGKLTDKHKEQVAKQEAMRLIKEKQEKQRKKNAAKRLAREVIALLPVIKQFIMEHTCTIDSFEGS